MVSTSTLGITHVTFIAGKIIIHVNFLIVEDIKSQMAIIGLDAIQHNRLHAHLHDKAKCILQQHQRKMLLHCHQSQYYAGLVLHDHVQSHHLRWSDPQFTTLDSKPASNIMAKIKRDHVKRRESRRDLSASSDTSGGQSSKHTLRSRGIELHELTHSLSRHGVESVWLSQRAKEPHGLHKQQSQTESSVIQLDHSFYTVPGASQNLKVLTFIETTISMCGAVTLPDLSAHQVAIEALEDFIMVTHTALQCNGQSGLMKLQDKVLQNTVWSGPGKHTWSSHSSWKSSRLNSSQTRHG